MPGTSQEAVRAEWGIGVMPALPQYKEKRDAHAAWRHLPYDNTTRVIKVTHTLVHGKK